MDVVLEDRAGDIVGIEVKASATIDASHFKGLKVLADAAGDRFVGGVVFERDPRLRNLINRGVAGPPGEGAFCEDTLDRVECAAASQIAVSGGDVLQEPGTGPLWIDRGS